MYETAPVNSFSGALRVKDFFHLMASVRILAIGIIPLIFAKFALSDRSAIKSVHLLWIMMFAGLLAIGFYVFFGFDCYVIHAQSYESILEIMASLTLALLLARKWYYDLVCLLSICYGVIVWIIAPLSVAQSVDAFPVLVLFCIALAICYGTAKAWLLSRALTDEPGA